VQILNMRIAMSKMKKMLMFMICGIQCLLPPEANATKPIDEFEIKNGILDVNRDVKFLLKGAVARRLSPKKADKAIRELTGIAGEEIRGKGEPYDEYKHENYKSYVVPAMMFHKAFSKPLIEREIKLDSYYPYHAASNGNVFVTMGYNYILYSNDGGKNWNKSNCTIEAPCGLVYAKGVFVTADADHIYTSEDGNKWKIYQKPPQVIFRHRDNSWGSVNYVGNIFIVTDNYGRVFTSENGYVWEKTNLFNKVTGDMMNNHHSIHRVGKTTLYVSLSRHVSASDNVRYWRLKEKMPSYYYLTTDNGLSWNRYNNEMFFTSCANNDRMFVFAGKKGKIYSSSNGINWTTTQLETESNFARIKYIAGNRHEGGIFIALTEDRSIFIGIQGAEGIKWERAQQANGGKKFIPSDIDYAKGKIVVVGDKNIEEED
jgi:hypothetical protein